MKQFNEKTLAVALKAITKGAVKTRDQIQEVAVWAVAQSITAGAAGAVIATAIMDALGGTKSLRRDSLNAYFERYGNLVWDKSEKKYGFLLNTRTGCTDGTLTSEYESIITGAMWDEAKKEAPIVSEWDMEKQVSIFLERMEKKALDPANKILNHEALAAVRIAYNRTVAQKTMREINALEGAELKAARDAAIDSVKPEPMTDRQTLAVQMKDGVQLAA